MEEPRAWVVGSEAEPNPAAAGQGHDVLERGVRHEGGQRLVVVQLPHRPGPLRAARHVTERAGAHAGEGGAVQVHGVGQRRVAVVPRVQVGLVDDDDVDGVAERDAHEVRALAHVLALAAPRQPLLVAEVRLAGLRQEGGVGLAVDDVVEDAGEGDGGAEGQEPAVVALVELVGARREAEPEEDEGVGLGAGAGAEPRVRLQGAQLRRAHVRLGPAVPDGVDDGARRQPPAAEQRGRRRRGEDVRRAPRRRPAVVAAVHEHGDLLGGAAALAEAHCAHVDPEGPAAGPLHGLDHHVPALA